MKRASSTMMDNEQVSKCMHWDTRAPRLQRLKDTFASQLSARTNVDRFD